MNRMFALIVAAIVAVAPACGSGGEDPESPRGTGSPEMTGGPGASVVGVSPGVQASQPPDAVPPGGTGGGEGGRDDGRSAPGGTPAPVKPAGEGEVNRPRAGRYTYDLSGTHYNPGMVSEEPYEKGSRLYTDVSGSGDVYTAKITSNDPNDPTTQTTRVRWEGSAVKLTFVGVESPPVLDVQCDVTPPVTVAEIPVAAKSFPTQRFANAEDDCEGTFVIKFAAREDVKDAAGRTWNAWRVETKTTMRLGTISLTIDGKEWLAPDLGAPVKSDTRTEGTAQGGGEFRSHDVTLLRAHP